MLELIRTLRTPAPPPHSKIILPEFNPDLGGTDARAWCITADLCMEEQPLQGSALVMAMIRALKGSAAAWISQISYLGITWSQLREIFLARYDTVETPTATLVRISKSRPKEGECLAAYAGRIMTTLMSRWQSMPVEEIAVSIVMAHCMKIEPQLQRLAFTSELGTRQKMQQELMAFAYRKRRDADVPEKIPVNGPTEAKRPRMNTPLKCFACGKIGHRVRECRNKKNQSPHPGRSQEVNDMKGYAPKRKSTVTYFKCGEVGHIAPRCTNLSASGSSSQTLRRVETCHIKSVSAQLTQSGGTPTAKVTTGELRIRLIDPNRTVRRRPYRLAPDERQVVRDKVKELLTAGIIRPSCSPFASSVLLVSKKDGSDRLCVDYRELNSNTVPDRYPLPLIADQIQRLTGANYFTTLDMASGFHQIPIHQDSVERTSFVTPDGQFEYLFMPFGLRNAPSVFQRAMNKALGDLANTFAICYLDDIIIPSRTVSEGMQRLRTVLEALTKAGFLLKLLKCWFLKMKVKYLGYVVTSGEIRPNPGKITALTQLPPPETVTQLRQFIGLASYFRQFIPRFSQLTSTLYRLTSGKGKVEWKPRYEEIRQKIISHLTKAPVLMIFNPNFPIELHTDASSDGYGAILMQKVEGKPRVVAYYSKRTTSAESHYHSYELETLAVVNGIKHFRHFLHGREFTVVTDCNSVKASRTKMDLTPRAHRWWAFLQTFTFDVIHREAEQQRDESICDLISKLENKELDPNTAKTYEIREGVLYRKVQVSKSHSGKVQAELHPIPKAAIAWHTVHIDATGKLSGKNNVKEYAFVVIDAFTKFALLFHTVRIDAASAIKALKSAVALFGAPTRVIVDQGRCFASKDFQDFCNSHNIALHLIATGTCRANGQVERFMSTINDMLTCVETSKERTWQQALDDVQLALNCTTSRVTEASPLELMIGRVARPLGLMTLSADTDEVRFSEIREQAARSIEWNAQKEKERFDNTKAKVSRFAVGDFVLLENHKRNQTKLDPKFKGPFKITDVLAGDRYCLKTLDSNRTYKYAHERLRLMPDCDVPNELNPCLEEVSVETQSESADVGGSDQAKIHK
nr:uncharacterized protein LOC124214362 [Neodiprion pinetum]